MDKLIKLLNEYTRSSFVKFEDGCFKEPYMWEDWRWDSATEVISKEYWFIKRLVDNGKINTKKVDEDRLETIQYSEKERITIYDWLLMILSIKDNPIEYLCSLLKEDMETILCSAILRDDESKPLVLCRRHWDGVWLKYQLYWEGTKQSQQGFMTSRYRWVDREEAFKIAKKAGQLKKINQIDWELINYDNETLLYSEYIW